MSETARAAIAGVCASVAFLVLFHAVTYPALFPSARPTISVALAVAIYVGIYLLLPRRRSLTERIRETLTDAFITPEEVAAAVNRARDRIETLREAGRRLPPGLQGRVLPLSNLAEQIVALVEADPSDLRRVGRFLRRDLAAASDLVDRYARLDTAILDPARAAEITRRFDASLVDFQRLFEMHRARTYDDDLFELEARLELLENREGGAEA